MTSRDSAWVICAPLSSPLAILESSFRNSGWSREEARLHARNALARLGVEGYVQRSAPSVPANPPDDTARQPLDPNTDPFEIIMDAFHMSGWTLGESYLHTRSAFQQMGVKGYDFKVPLPHNPLLALRRAYYEGGWSWDEARLHAHNSFATLGVAGFEMRQAPEVPAKPRFDDDRSLLSPMSDPIALLVNVLQSTGWERQEAIDHAVQALIRKGAVVLEHAPNCAVRKVVIEYCMEIDGYVYQRHWEGYINKLCWEQLFVPQPCTLPNCAGNDVPWHYMTLTAACQAPVPTEGCVRIHFGEEDDIPCTDPNILQCDCFVEQHCSEIQQVVCCPEWVLGQGGGCPGCPCSE